MNKSTIEEQYKLIEFYLNEANVKYDKKTQEILGAKINDMHGNIGEGKTSEFFLKSGNKLVLKCISEKDDNFIFTIVEDDSKVFKKWDNVSIVIKTGNGDNNLLIYKLNQKVVSTQDNGNSFDLIFNANKNNGLKDKIKLNKVDRVVVTNSAPTTEPEEQPNQEPNKEQPKEKPKKSEEKDNKSEEKLEKDGKESLAYMLNDPLLKKAFYEQPSLWNLFVAELTGKKPKGKGIITIDKIVNKYDDKKWSDNLGGTFVKDKEVWFVPIDKIKLKPIDGGDVVELTNINKVGYETICIGKDLDEGPKIKGNIDGITYIIEIIEPLEDEELGFLTKVSVLNDNRTISKPIKKRITILDNKSEGFVKNKD
jgi:hypothetical protein